MEKDTSFDINLRNSFKKVKDDIDSLRENLQELANELKEIQKEVKSLKKENELFSTGNKGVLSTDTRQTLDRHSTDRQFSAPQTIDRQSFDRQTTQFNPLDQELDQNEKDKKTINQEFLPLAKLSQTIVKGLNQEIPQLLLTEKEIIKIFQTLTNKEFLIFTAIYQIEEETNTFVLYSELAKHLKLSQSSVRTHVNELFLKKAPLEKHILGNRKVSLSIKKLFKDLNLMGKLLSLKSLSPQQKTLQEV